MSNLKALIGNGRGFKSINPWDPDDTPQAWTGGQSTAPSGRLVPVVYAAWQLRCKALADLPFCIYGKGDSEIDNSDDYQGVVKCLPDPYQTFWKMEGSLCGSGRYYFYKEQNSSVLTALRYWTAESVTEIKYDLKKYIPEKFERNLGEKKVWYPAEDVHYCWLPDPAVEVGPPTVWPLLSALLVANSLDSVNKFINDYASRGFAKMFLLAISGQPPQQEKERIENWWNSFWNKANTVRWRIFNADKIEPTVIGEGLEALNGQEITTALQEQVLAAMGVPASLIMANAANYATAEQDVRTFYQNTIVPEARIIQSALNVQVLEPMGYHLEFEPERLETFQTDEAERATALSTLAGVLTDSSPEAVTLSMSILGYDLTPEQEKMLAAMVAQKQADRDWVAQQMNTEPKEQETSDEEPEESEYAGEMNKWMRKALKHIGKDVNFVSDKIPASVQARVHKTLPTCASEEDVMKVFATPEPERGDPAIMALAEALREAAKAVSVTPIPQASPNVSIVLPETMKMEQLPTVVNVPAPVVNVSVEPTPVTVTNDVKVEPTPVKVENKVDVQPATVKATEVKQTKQPKSRKEKQKILRNKEGQMEGSETTVTYEY